MWIRLFITLLYLMIYAPIVQAETTTSFANRPEVKTFIQSMVKKHHFREADLVKLFNSVEVRPTVIKSIRMPLEQRPWHTYQSLFVTEWRIRKGVEFWKQNEQILALAEKKYGIPADIIVATIGIETKYGMHTGEYPVIDALTNISFSNSPRAAFFRSELEEFLLLTREQHLDPFKVMGSYAGAIGQPQFMPSSYRRYAVSYKGGKKIDLSHDINDIIVSIANYYNKKGWDTNSLIALPASLVSHTLQFYDTQDDVKIVAKSTLAAYHVDHSPSVLHDNPYKIIELQNYWEKEYWYTFHNFDVIKRYNSSDLYAMAVFQLSRYLTKLREKELDHV